MKIFTYQLYARITKEQKKAIEQAIENKVYPDISTLVRDALDIFLGTKKQSAEWDNQGH